MKTYLKNTIISVASFATLVFQFANAESVKGINFPAEKNKIQVLPQRFEYNLLDSEKIKIGDILIDAQLLSLELIKSENSDKYKLKINWPAGLLQDGEINLINNNGKSILNIPIVKENIQVAKQESAEYPGLRADLAQLTTDYLSSETFESMKFSPFMRFCAFKSSGNTRIELCSKELYLFSKDGLIVVKSRNSNIKQSVVLINGKPVGEQGLVYLNDLTQNLVFRAEAISGATLDIETRKQDVEFKDFTISSNQKNLVIQASGAEPVVQKGIERLPNNVWKTSTSLDRPVVYLEGAGGIPLRQEFFIKQTPPQESQRIFIDIDTPIKTYSSTLVVYGKLPKGAVLKSEGPSSRLKSLGKGKGYQWILSDLKTGEINKRYVQTQYKEGSWIAGYDVERGFSTEFFSSFGYYTPWAQVRAELGLKYWFENFLWINSDLTTEKWGLEINSSTSLTQKSDFPKFSRNAFSLLYRFSSGLNFKDPPWGLRLGIAHGKLEAINISQPIVGIFSQSVSPSFYAKYFNWTSVDLNYFSALKNDNIDLKSSIQLAIKLQKNWTQQFIVESGITLETWDATPDMNLEKFQFGLNAGIRYLY